MPGRREQKGISASEIVEEFDDLTNFIFCAIEERADAQESDEEAAELFAPQAIEDAEEDAVENKEDEDDDEKQ